VALPAVPVAQTPEDRFREYLESRRPAQRFTSQQRQLVKHIFARHTHFDPEQLVDDLRAAGRRVSRSTVYRSLGKLVEAGLLKKIEIGARTVYDHDYGYPQHEHLVCEQCGTMIEFQHPAIEAAVRDVTGQQRFRADGHTLVVRGTCAACNAERAAKRRLVM
jgi:Fur family ferric uptake transcriptional regulator